MSGSRAVVNTGLRLGVAVVVTAAAVLGTALAIGAGLPGHRSTAVSADVAPPAGTSVLACNGPILALGRESDSVSQISVASAQEVTRGAGPRTSTTKLRALRTPDVAGDSGPLVLTTPAQGRAPAQVAASGSASVSAADLSGFAASACQPATAQSWLVGGSAATGSTDLVLLSNPGEVAATVQMTVYGPNGAMAPPGGSDVIVAPHTQRVVPLAGLALGTGSPVVKVVSSGAPVQASMQTSIIRTLVPGGVDQVSAIATASRIQQIPGVRVTASSDSSSSPLTVLRLLAPTADTKAVATVRRLDGRAVLTRTVPLTAGQPVEVSLDGLAAGEYSVRVAAPAATVAAVWSATGTGAGDDFAWNAAVPVIRTSATVAVPAGDDPVLSVANTGTRPAVFALKPVAGGATQKFTVPVGSTQVVHVSAATVYTLTARQGAQVAASVSFGAAHALAAFPVWAADAASPELTVYP